MSTWQDRAKARMKQLGITQEDLIDIFGVTTRGAVGHYLSGRRQPSIEQIGALSERLNFANVDELLSGKTYDVGRTEIIPVQMVRENDYNIVQVPRVRFKLSAGVSGFAIEAEPGNGKPIFFRPDWFAMNGYKPEKLFAVRVSGASMEPSLWDGDLVVINTDNVAPSDGDCFAINYEGELVIKRLRRDAGEWWATSDNTDQRRFAPKRCTEDVKIIGRVVYKQSERI